MNLSRLFYKIVFCLIIFFLFAALPFKSFSDSNSAFNTGIIHLRTPDYRRAYSCFQSALSTSKKDGDRHIEIQSLLELGRLAALFSKSDSSLFYLNSGISLLEKYFPDNDTLEGSFAFELGKANEEQGNIEAAGDFYKQAIEKFEIVFGKTDIRTALAYSEYSGYFTFKRMPEPELNWSKKAYNILSSANEHNPRYVCPILIQHATAIKEYFCQNLDSVPVYYPEIRNLYKRSLKIARSYYKSSSIEEGVALQGLGNTYTDLILKYYTEKRPDADAVWEKANALYSEAIQVKKAALGEYNASIATSRYTLALTYRYHPSLEKNIICLAKFNEAMSALGSSFVNNDPLNCPASTYSYNPHFFSVLLKNKADVLDILYSKTRDIKYLKAQHELNMQRLIVWDYILGSFSRKDIGSVISIWNDAPFEEAIQTAFNLYQLTGNNSYSRLIFDIAEKGKNNEHTQFLIQKGIITKGNQNFRSYSISLDSLQKKLPDSCAFIEYIQSPPFKKLQSFGLVVTKKTYTVLKLASKEVTDSLQLKLFEAMRAGNSSAYDYASNKLYQLLLLPFLKSLEPNLKRIIICPSGSLSKIPFEALTVSQSKSQKRDFSNLNYLLHTYTTSYALNAGITFNTVFTKNTKGLAVFVPESDSMPELLFSRKQAGELQKKYKGEFFFEENASLSNFLLKAPGKSVLQISTHSVSNEVDGKDGYLLFQDKVLNLGVLYGSKLPLDLCIISACQTGTGKLEYAEGSKSFAREFSYAGAKGTISTLWSVDDKSTATVLSSFYSCLNESNPPESALRLSKILFLNSTSNSELANPFYWAGLVYSGNQNIKLNLEHNSINWGFALILSVIILLLGIYSSCTRNSK